MITVIGFALAAAAGASVRHVLRIALAHVGPIPVGTLVVTLTGSFLMGLVSDWDPPAATVVGVAGVGALTTFSTFSAEVLELRARGPAWMVGYAVVSVIGGVTLAWFGLRLA